MKKDYVPSSNGAFRSWVISLHTMVSANAAAWGISPLLITEFGSRLSAFLLLFTTVENKFIRTTEQVLTYETNKAEFTVFLRSLVQVNLVRNTAIPYASKIAMNLNPRTPASERPDIETTPIIVLANAARGVVRLKLLVVDMGKRAKIHPNANGAELRFYLTSIPPMVKPAEPETPTDPQQQVTEPPVPTPVPVVPAANKEVVMETSYTTRATFDRKMEIHLGKAFVVQARWVNTTDDKKNSTWSDFVTIIIS